MTELCLKRDHRASSYVLASCVLGVILMRLIMYYIPFSVQTYADDIIRSLIFTLPVQLMFFLIVPFCIFKFYGRRTVKQTLEFSSIGRFKPFYLLAFPLGIAVYFMTIGISSAWSGFLSLTGYTYTSSSTPKPEIFSAGLFVADIVLTAVLPAVCEEFCMRGGLLTTAKRSFTKLGCVLLFGLMFGLFHQNIRQVFYTSLFGALAAYIVIETKSLYPAMIMHFTNNFLSVFFDYASDYGWAFGDVFAAINGAPVAAVAVAFFLISLAGYALVMLILYCNEKQEVVNKIKRLRAAAELKSLRSGQTQAEIAPIASEAQTPTDNQKSAGEVDYPERPIIENRFIKPSLSDVMLAVAMGVTAMLTTVFTYVWGFFY